MNNIGKKSIQNEKPSVNYFANQGQNNNRLQSDNKSDSIWTKADINFMGNKDYSVLKSVVSDESELIEPFIFDNEEFQEGKQELITPDYINKTARNIFQLFNINTDAEEEMDYSDENTEIKFKPGEYLMLNKRREDGYKIEAYIQDDKYQEGNMYGDICNLTISDSENRKFYERMGNNEFPLKPQGVEYTEEHADAGSVNDNVKVISIGDNAVLDATTKVKNRN